MTIPVARLCSTKSCTYRGAASLRFLGFLALEGIEQPIWQRFKEARRHGKFALIQSNRALTPEWLLDWPNLIDRHITFAQNDRLAFLDPAQMLGEMSLGLMYIEPNHGSIIDLLVN